MWRKISINPWFIGLVVLYLIGGQGIRMALAFFVITLHELTHAIVAESYGCTVERIELWPFGGIARISGIAQQEPYVEAMIAVVGPLQNFFLASAAWGLARWLPVSPSWLHLFIEMNLGLGFLNLLPAAPLDGGHLARLYLARRMGYEQAERIVVEAGLWLARFLFVVTIFSFLTPKPLLSLGIFAVFIYWGAQHSPRPAAYLIVRDLAIRPSWLKKRPVWALDDFAVHCETSLGEVLRVMRPMKYHRVVVLSPDLKKMGILYEEDLLKGLEEWGPSIALQELLTMR
ncbi:MAG: peptidase M50 [Sulfobacillus thermosulfidooxidans]|uniref:Peptidase M50 n=1 Tax=Sulfobacillus thermotolerans TaxID=338644 RepID=A0ABM6RP81_9FIRM|nr:site-2 protease family protein [Sulfobacillus sp. hq2]AUW93168.1 peptidase M50 [Sulfobacillus thermotolerans]MCY0908401.1 site-2 protease family protein [Sulfobacillus thermotolerans]POB11800.1 peptidase M50 [Sulfobacillus sp. hq2]PSR32237.1 MAG: peptidase M50 [Sulfobacillus thermosulfidooxidans]